MLYISNNSATEYGTPSSGVLPVVTLKSDVQLEKNKVVIATETATDEDDNVIVIDITEDVWAFK